MSKTPSDLRPPGSVERDCDRCHWRTWFDPLAKEAEQIPYLCQNCLTNPIVSFKCTACNRHDKKEHLELVAEQHEYAHHCRWCLHADVPYRKFAGLVYCWSCSSISEDTGILRLATQIKRWPNSCDCPACWQKFFHVCDEHAASWIHDLEPAEQKAALRARGATIVELADGSWTSHWPEPELVN